MKRMLLTAAIILAAATSAQADDKFGTMDTDGNGVVSWEEFQKAYPQMRKPAFDAVDTDGDGSMTHDEWHGFRSRHGEGGKGMGGKSMEGMMQGMPPRQHAAIRHAAFGNALGDAPQGRREDR